MAILTIPHDVKHLMLAMLFKGESGPSELWVGLSSMKSTGDVKLADLERGEPSGSPNCVRQNIVPSNWVMSREGDRATVSAEHAAFMKLGENRWPGGIAVRT